MGVFAVGLNDTATGANLPSIQEHYDLPYAVVSLVFLAGFGGYVQKTCSQFKKIDLTASKLLNFVHA